MLRAASTRFKNSQMHLGAWFKVKVFTTQGLFTGIEGSGPHGNALAHVTLLRLSLHLLIVATWVGGTVFALAGSVSYCQVKTALLIQWSSQSLASSIQPGMMTNDAMWVQ